RREWRAMAAPMLAPLGTIGYFSFLWLWTGDATAWGDTQWHGWHERFVPHQSALDVVHYLRGRFHDVSLMVVVISILFAIFGAVKTQETAEDAVPETATQPVDPPRSTLLERARTNALRWAEPLAIYGASRLAILATVWTVSRILPPLTPGGMLASWDGEWYSALADQGYPAHVPKVGGVASKSVIAFFPVYPL